MAACFALSAAVSQHTTPSAASAAAGGLTTATFCLLAFIDRQLVHCLLAFTGRQLINRLLAFIGRQLACHLRQCPPVYTAVLPSCCTLQSTAAVGGPLFTARLRSLSWLHGLSMAIPPALFQQAGMAAPARVGHPFFSKERSVLSILFRSL